MTNSFRSIVTLGVLFVGSMLHSAAFASTDAGSCWTWTSASGGGGCKGNYTDIRAQSSSSYRWVEFYKMSSSSGDWLNFYMYVNGKYYTCTGSPSLQNTWDTFLASSGTHTNFFIEFNSQGVCTTLAVDSSSSYN